VYPYDFTITNEDATNLVTALGGTATVTITQLVTGVVYTDCTGTQVVPSDKALSNGQFYYGRVFAVNEVGYSLPQSSPVGMKPMVVPGAPTSVTLSVTSLSQLLVTFNPPASDGGDAITAYQIDYAKSSDFSDMVTTNVTFLGSGAPFTKTLGGLDAGEFYYTRVNAQNSQGYGVATASTPGSLNPHQVPNAPSNVQLRVTSDTMLTVSFAYPENDGGDTVTGYRVEWDQVPGFNGITMAPNKGFVDLDSASFSSYTIEYLTIKQRYYVKVYARNAAGLGTPSTSSPAFAAPSLEVPGKPHTVIAATGLVSGTVSVFWQRPLVPWHNIPCSGLITDPKDCPTAIGGGNPKSDGGADITEYVVAYNEAEDFSGLDHGEIVTTKFAIVISGLTPGRFYYIRILARNTEGSGQYCAYSDVNCLIVANAVYVQALV